MLRKHCHILKGPLCLYKSFENMPREFHMAFVQYEYYRRGVIYQDNPKCVSKTLNFLYWEASKKPTPTPPPPSPKHIDLTVLNIALISFMVVLVVFWALLLIRWIRRRKKENQDEKARLLDDKAIIA